MHICIYHDIQYEYVYDHLSTSLLDAIFAVIATNMAPAVAYFSQTFNMP